MGYFRAPAKDPNSVEPYFFVWCDEDGTNDGTTDDKGELQGATISTKTITVSTGLTVDTDNVAAVTIAGISYPISTVNTIWLSGGTDETDYDLSALITTTDGRTLQKTMTIPVRHQ